MKASTEVRITGWKTGFQTISMMKLIMETGFASLRAAKGLVETVLDGGEVTIPFATEDRARAFLARAELLGIIGRVESR